MDESDIHYSEQKTGGNNMNAVGKIVAIIVLMVVIPIVDIFLVPILLGLIFIPGVMVPVIGALIAVAFLHYILIKAILDSGKKSDKSSK